MNALNRSLNHIAEAARIPSFSSYEERIHPYIKQIFSDIPGAARIPVSGNNLIFKIAGNQDRTVALAAHLDKIDHFGEKAPHHLPVAVTSEFIEGAMDDSIGVGTLLTLAELTSSHAMPDVLFFFSEMEESKGLKEHPARLKNSGKGYESGMGARQIAQTCIKNELIPDEIITVDTTPLFKGETGIALYSKHWELNDLKPTSELIHATEKIEKRFLTIEPEIKPDNNTNDYLHYGREFNQTNTFTVPSVALEPAIFPYHQKGERVFISDIKRVLDILVAYLND